MKFSNPIGRPQARRAGAAVLFLCAVFSAPLAWSHAGHAHHATAAATTQSGGDAAAVPVFTASTAKSFDQLMNDAMLVMDYGMLKAPMNGTTDHDFVTMMIPHHQGAVDMAKAVLLYSKDAGIRNLALGIIAEQQNEINLMNAFLKKQTSQTGE